MQKELLQQTNDIAKVAIKSEKITHYGGLSHEMDIFSKRRIEKLIESTLCQRETRVRLSNIAIYCNLFSIAIFL